MALTILNVAFPLAPVGPDAVGGSEQVLTALDRSLVRAGHRSLVVACEGSVTTGQLIAIPRGTGSINPRTRARAAADCRSAIDLALRQSPVDVVHLHGFDFHSYLPPAGVPVLATLHLPYLWYPPEIFKLERPWTFYNCVSEAQERDCPAFAGMVGCIENGVPREFFASRHSKRELALSLGRICPEKGFHIALDAARRAGMKFFLGGEVFPYPEHEHYYRYEILPRLDQFRRFLGPVGLHRKRRLLAGARCLVAPSLVEETSSLVALEALASATPVVAFPSGALADIVEDGVTGFLVQNLEEMAGALVRTKALDPAVCRQKARERYREELMVSRYLELYELIAGLRLPAQANAPGDLAGLSFETISPRCLLKTSVRAPL